MSSSVVSGIEPHRQRLGINIRTARKRAALTIEALAEASDLHPVYVGNLERGEENVSVDTLIRIASALDTTIAALVEGI